MCGPGLASTSSFTSGPDREDCIGLQELLEHLGYEKGYCHILPIPQDTVVLIIGNLP